MQALGSNDFDQMWVYKMSNDQLIVHLYAANKFVEHLNIFTSIF